MWLTGALRARGTFGAAAIQTRQKAARGVVGTVVEALEPRFLLSWIGATSGSTNDAAHNYNSTANWSGGVINDSFASVNFSANTTLYLSAARTTASTGLNFNYAGNFNLTLESSSTTAETLTIAGGISDSTGGHTRSITLGNSANPLNLALSSANQTLNIASGDQLLILGVISSGGITKSGTGTLTLSGANTYASGTTLSAGQLNINAAAALGTGALTIGGGSIDNTSGAAVTLNNISQTWSGNFTFVGSNPLSLGAGAVAMSAARTVTVSASTLTDSGVISGAFSLTKLGTGTLALAGADTFTGGATISAGTLLADNSTGSATGTGAVAVSSGATLGGTGAVSGAVNVASGGFLAPGSGATSAILSTGTLTLSSGSTLKSILNGTTAGTGYSQVNVTGNATVTGSMLSLSGTSTAHDGSQLTIVKISGTETGTFTGLAQGGTIVSNGVTYSASYTGGSGHSIVLTANPAATTTAVASSANPAVFGQSVTFTATVTSSGSGIPTGTITFKDGSTTLGTATLNGSGQATFSTSALAVASHSITAAYGGSTSFTAGTSATLTQTINPAATTTTVGLSPNPSVFGQSITLTATVAATAPGSGIPTGTVTFKDGTTTLGAAALNASGQGTFSTSSLSVAAHSITAVYSATTNFATSTSSVATQTVNAAATTTTVGLSPNPSVFGQSITLTATVAATAPGSGIPTGTVTFKDGTTTLGTATLNASGQGTFSTASLSVAAHSITAVYSATTNFATSTSSAATQTVNAAATTTTVGLSPNPSVFGQSITLTATVSATAPGSGIPTGTVTFKDGTTTLGTATLNSSGQGTFSTASLSVAAHSITAVYSATTNFATSTSSAATQTVNAASTTTTVASSANPGVFGQSITFTATVLAVSPGSGIPTGTVTFKDGATTLGSASLNASGQGTFKISTLAVGSHSITAVYSASSSFSGSTSAAVNQTINPAATMTTVVPSANPSVFGQSVTLTATVIAAAPGSGTPTGSVTFKDGSTTLGTSSLNGSGQATLGIASLSVAAHSITASYAGNSNFTASVSSNLTQTINKAAASVSVISSTNPQSFGQSVTFTATVSAIAPGAGLPTGTVTFFDGSTSIGSSSLNASGQATLMTAALSLGTHSITAGYGGDGNFAGGNSTAISQTIAPLSPSNLSPTIFGVNELDLSWTDTSSGQAVFRIERSVSGGAYSVIANLPAGTTSFQDIGLTPGSAIQYHVFATIAGADSLPAGVSATLPAYTGAPATLLVSDTPGTLRNNLTGWVGMAFTTGPNGLIVTSLGRLIAAGNNATHNLKLVDATTGQDVSGSTVTVNAAGATAGQILYATLSSPITLAANHKYYLVSHEIQGGDQWYDNDSVVNSTSAATINSSAWAFDGSGYNAGTDQGHSYVVVDLKYSTTLPAAPTGLTATAGNGSVTLNWTNADPLNTGQFKLQRKIGSSGTFITLATFPVSVTQYVDHQLSPGTDYFYRVCGLNNSGDSPFSATADAIPTQTALPFADNFTRPDNSNLGIAWANLQGSLGISGNTAVSNSSGPDFAVVDGLISADQSATVTVDISALSNNFSAGIVLRQSGTAMYYGDLRKTFGGVEADISTGGAGNWRAIGSVVLPNLADSATIAFAAIGNALGLYVNGVLEVSLRDSTFANAGTVGLYADDAGAKFNNFSVAALTGGSTNATFPFTDNFNRADNLFVGTNWTVQQGDFVVASNQLLSTAAGSPNESVATVNGSAPSDLIVSADVDTTNGGLFGWAGVMARAGGSGSAVNAYVLRLHRNLSNTYVELCLKQGGSYSILDSQSVSSETGTLTLEIVGTSLLGYFDGALVGQAVDATLAAGSVGVTANDASDTIDNFSAAVDTAPAPLNAAIGFSDSFNRASTTFLGGYWTEQQGNYAVSNNQLIAVNAGQSAATVNGLAAGDVTVSANIDLLSGDFNSSSIGLDARISAAGRYRAQIRKSTGSYIAEILRLDGSTWTTLDSRYIPQSGAGILRFELRGSSLLLFLNGEPVAMANDSTYSTGGVGIAGNSGQFTRNITLDDFSATVPVAAPTPQNATLPLADNFNRPDSTFISPLWSVTQGEFSVGQNALMSLVGGESRALLNGISAANVDAVMTFDMTAGATAVGIDARVAGTNAYRGEISGGNAQILVELNGQWTPLDSRPVVWPIVNGRTTDVGIGTLRFDLNGSQLGLYLNDQLISSASDSRISAPGTIGLYANGAASLDNLSLSNFAAPAPQNAALTFDDSFSRPDNTVILGSSWIESAGDFAIVSNQLTSMSLGNSVATLLGVSQGDAIVSGNVNVPAGQSIGLVARYSGPGDANYYLGDLSAGGGAEIWKNVNGVRTLLASAAAGALAGTLRFEVVGNQLSLFLNDALLISAADSSITAPGSVGVAAIRSGTSPAATLTNFDARIPSSVPNAYLALPTQSSAAVDYWLPGTALTNVGSGEFNGDGRNDLFGYDPATGNLVVGLSGGPNSGDTAFTTQIWGDWSPSVAWTNFTLGDFNGDGRTDVAAFNPSTGNWSVATSNGTSFTTSTWAMWNPANNWQDVVAGDFNGDGRADLAAWNATTGTWQVAISTGTSFNTTVWRQGTIGTVWQSVAAGDFNGDGRSDLAALDAATGNWHVELSAGSSFNDAVWTTWSSAANWTSIHAADLNGDGLTDLIGKLAGSSSWQVALSTGSGFSNQSWGTQAANLVNEQIGDFNGDGKADIAGQVAGTRQWRVELSTGSNFTDQYWLTTSAADAVQSAAAANVFGLSRVAAQDFAAVYNNVQYTPYTGEMKGPTATQQTGSGNDWDQDALLVQLLSQSGIAAQYVSGRVSLPLAAVLNWLAVKDDVAANNVLSVAGLHPVVIDAGLSTETFQFDHTWIEAWLPGPGGLGWAPLDPSIKSKNIQTGIANLYSDVPFNQAGYLAHVTPELPIEYYEDQVAAYLAANNPGKSIADAAYDGPIIAKQFVAPPTSLPFSIVGTPTVYSSIPATMQHRVEFLLEDLLPNGAFFENILDVTLNVPDISLQTLAITYTKNAAGAYMPELRVGGNIYSASPFGYTPGLDIMRLVINHFDAGNATTTPDATTSYEQAPGIIMAIGLDASQFSQQSVIALQDRINAESLSLESGQTTDPSAALEDGMSLAIMECLQAGDDASHTIASLYQLKDVRTSVGDGIITADPSQVQEHWDLAVPVMSPTVSFDIEGAPPVQLLPTTSSVNQEPAWAAALSLLAANGSDAESNTLEKIYNTQAISAVEGIQYANDQGIPILTIDAANEAQLLPTLTIPSSYVSYVQSFLAQGATVTVPRDLLTPPLWSGTVMRAENLDPDNFLESDLVLGNAATHGAILGWLERPKFAPVLDLAAQAAGDPVNLSNGSFLREDSDVSIPNIGIPLDFARRYISGSTTDIGLGQGWTDTYGDTIATEADGSVLWTDSQGASHLFSPPTGGVYADPAGIFGKLVLGAGGFVYTDPFGNVRSFNSAGRLQKIADSNGNALLITYDGQGNLLAVTDANDSSRYLSFTSVGGHIATISDFTGRTWTFGYQTVLNPTTGQTIYLLDSRTSPSDATTPATTLEYFYNTSGPLLGLLSSITNSADGSTIRISYFSNGGVYSVTDPQGDIEHFFYDPFHQSTTFIDALGRAQTSEFDANGLTIKLINPDRTREYSTWSNDLLQSQTDEIGRTESFTYDANGNILTWISFDGVETDTQYDPVLSRPTKLTQPGGRVTNYSYDTHGNLLSMTDAMGDQTTFVDDPRGQLLSITDPNGNVADPTGNNTTTYTYNGAGQVLTTTTGLPSSSSATYDSRGDQTSVTDATGDTTYFQYDILGRLIQTTEPDPDGAGPLTAPISTIAYLPAQDETVSTDPLGLRTTIAKDANGFLAGVTDPDGTFISYVYDAVGNLIAMTDARGKTTQYIYDSRDRLIQTILPDGSSTSASFNAVGDEISATDANGNLTQYACDSLGRLASVTNAAGQTTAYTYDSVNNIASVTTPLGTTTYTHDLLDRVTQTRAPGGVVGTTDYDANGNVIRQTQYDVSGLGTIPGDPRTLPANRQHSLLTAYDVLNRPIEQTDAAGEQTFTSYDAAGRVLSTTDSLGHTTTYTYDNLGREITMTGPDPDGAGPLLAPITLSEYDADGNLIAQTDPLGQTTTYAYDALNRLTSTTAPDPDGAGPLASPVTSFAYDAAGDQTSVTDPDGNTTYSVFDSVGRNVAVYNAIGVKSSTVYDADGNVIASTDADGRLTQFTYDSLNRLQIEKWIAADGVTVLRTIQYQYNNLGQLSSISDPDASLAFAYTAAGQVTSIDNAGTPNMPDVVLNQSFDGFGNRTTLNATPNGSSILTNSYQYDPLGQMLQVNQTGPALTAKQANFSYNALGQFTQMTLAAAEPVASAIYGYDQSDRLTSLAYANASSGSTIAAYGYTYDSDGQVVGLTLPDGSVAYTYDHDGQLTSAAGSGLPASQSFGYDANGNRTSSANVVGPDNELLSDGTYNYAYDADGNLITKTAIATGATINYTWDYRNRLTDVTDKTAAGITTSHVHYVYDPLDRRIAQQVDSNGDGVYDTTERYIYDGDNLILVLDANGSVTHTFLNGPGTNQVLADDTGGGVTWLLADQQGTVRDCVDSNGNSVDHIVYDSFGNILSQTNAAAQPRFGFSGMQLDAATGLYQDRARYYDPATGRFISEDPSGFGGGDANLYRYAGNDPATLIDPSGLNARGASGGTSSGAAGAGVGASGGLGNGSGWGQIPPFPEQPPTGVQKYIPLGTWGYQTRRWEYYRQQIEQAYANGTITKEQGRQMLEQAAQEIIIAGTIEAVTDLSLVYTVAGPAGKLLSAAGGESGDIAAETASKDAADDAVDEGADESAETPATSCFVAGTRVLVASTPVSDHLASAAPIEPGITRDRIIRASICFLIGAIGGHTLRRRRQQRAWEILPAQTALEGDT